MRTDRVPGEINLPSASQENQNSYRNCHEPFDGLVEFRNVLEFSQMSEIGPRTIAKINIELLQFSRIRELP